MKRKPNDNVVVFRKGTQRFAVAEEVMEELRMRMYNYEPQDLADAIGKSKSCIYAIRAGRVGWPRGGTFFSLLEAMDIELRLYAIREQRYI
jgi:hypothetical protein